MPNRKFDTTLEVQELEKQLFQASALANAIAVEIDNCTGLQHVVHDWEQVSTDLINLLTRVKNLPKLTHISQKRLVVK